MAGIKAIMLPLPYRLGTVNCYLVDTGDGYVLIDTGAANKRSKLESELRSAACRPGDLRLIVITHGDFDHTGNAAYLRDQYGARIVMHQDDSGMAERGDMFWNRKSGSAVLRIMAPILFGFVRANRFAADVYVGDGTDLRDYGFDARVVAIPGHSKGSIGILTAGGDLFCGDLLANDGKPALNSIMDEPAAGQASVEKLSSLEIQTVYPGHGGSFPIDLLGNTNQAPS